MDNLLISGSSGFVGSNLIPYLKNNFNCESLSRFDSNINSVTYKNLEEEINSYFGIIHLAGKAHDLKKVTNESEYFDVNTDLTKRVFDQFLNSNCKVFIFLSSVKAVADETKNILLEDVLPNPKSAYGKSKLLAEKYILENLPSTKYVYILRPCMIHGEGNKGNLNLLYNFIAQIGIYPFGKYSNKRSYLQVNNLSFIIEKLLKQTPDSGVYNVADDYGISTIDLARLIGTSLNKRTKIFNIPKYIINPLATCGSLLKLPFNKERLEKLTESYVVSNRKIKKALLINTEFDTLKGLEKTINSFNKD